MVFLKYLAIYFLGYLVVGAIEAFGMIAWLYLFEKKNKIVLIDAEPFEFIASTNTLSGLRFKSMTLYTAIVICFWPVTLPWVYIENIMLIKKYYKSTMIEEP